MKNNKEDVLYNIEQQLLSIHAKDIKYADLWQIYDALAGYMKSIIGKHWLRTMRNSADDFQIYWLSLEYTTGRMLDINAYYLDRTEEIIEALKQIDIDYEELKKAEMEPGLGIGDLGILSFGFLDAFASLEIKVFAYGIRYRRGLFKQKIEDYRQKEYPDPWLSRPNAWEYRRDIHHDVAFNDFSVNATAYDIPILGCRNGWVNSLRLWDAQNKDDINFDIFHQGDILHAYESNLKSEAIVQFLYPDNSTWEGKLLRLEQEYFYVSASCQDIIRREKIMYGNLEKMSEHTVIVLNDTMTVISLLEMGYRLTQEGFTLEEAYQMCKKMFVFVSYSVLDESFEHIDMSLFHSVLPHLEKFLYFCLDKNKAFLKNYGLTDRRIDSALFVHSGRLSALRLALFMCQYIFARSEEHIEELKYSKLPSVYMMMEEKFQIQQGGILHRRWMFRNNPPLTDYLSNLLGEDVQKDYSALKNLENHVDSDAPKEISRIKQEYKNRLAESILHYHGDYINPYSIFQVNASPVIHEYKRQLLTAFYVAGEYFRLKDDPNQDVLARTFIFGGKASPGYWMAKEIVAFLASLQHLINSDISIKDKLKVIFLENYGFDLEAEIINATDVFELTSTPRDEIEISAVKRFMIGGSGVISSNPMIKQIMPKEHKGNFFIFQEDINKDCQPLNQIFERLISNSSTEEFPYYFPTLYENIEKYNDGFNLYGSFNSYYMAQERMLKAYKNQMEWQKNMAVQIGTTYQFDLGQSAQQFVDFITG